MPKRDAKGVSSGVGLPHRMEGRDGDITIRRTRDGKVVYIKEHGSWHPINTGIDVSKLKKEVDRLSRLEKSNKNSNAIITTNLINVRKNTSTASVDPQIKFTIGGTEKFTLGVDDSDGDKFKIDTGGAIGGATKLTMDSSGNVTAAGSLTATKAILSTTANVADLGTSNGESGYATSDKIYKINTQGLFVNAANITDSVAFLAIASEADNDAYMQLFDGTALKWGLGYDQDDSGEFKIFSGAWSTGSERLSLTTAGNLTVAGTITSSAGTLGTGDITGVTLTGDSGGALADTAGSADFTIAGGTNCATSGSGSTITVNVDDSFIVNNAADVMAVSDFGANAAFKIDADQPATAGAEDSTGLHIDYDRIVAGSGTAAHNDIGIDLDVNSASLGTSSVKGMDIDVVGATSGTHTATGIELDVSGADDHTGIAITTPDAANGREDIKIMSSANSGDYCSIFTFTNGATTIKTVDADSSDADFSLDADGDITLNSQTGVFIAEKGGTEFSAANSSYAGMILGYTRIQNDGTGNPNNQVTMDATLTALQTVAGTYLSIAFTAPPSGNVEIQMIASVYASSKTVEFALVSDTSATEIDETHTYDGGAQSSDETDINMTTVSFAVTGLTAGSSYTYYIAGAETSSGTSYIRHGRFRSTGTHYPPIIIKAIALPASITTGE